jgi:hypothetical protein
MISAMATYTGSVGGNISFLGDAVRSLSVQAEGADKMAATLAFGDKGRTDREEEF